MYSSTAGAVPWVTSEQRRMAADCCLLSSLFLFKFHFFCCFFYFAGVYLEFKVQYSEYFCGNKSLREICPYVLVDGDLVLCCDVIMPLSRSKQKDGERWNGETLLLWSHTHHIESSQIAKPGLYGRLSTLIPGRISNLCAFSPFRPPIIPEISVA